MFLCVSSCAVFPQLTPADTLAQRMSDAISTRHHACSDNSIPLHCFSQPTILDGLCIAYFARYLARAGSSHANTARWPRVRHAWPQPSPYLAPSLRSTPLQNYVIAVRRIHLVFLLPPSGPAPDRITERTVKIRCIFRRVSHDLGMNVAKANVNVFTTSISIITDGATNICARFSM